MKSFQQKELLKAKKKLLDPKAHRAKNPQDKNLDSSLPPWDQENTGKSKLKRLSGGNASRPENHHNHEDQEEEPEIEQTTALSEGRRERREGGKFEQREEKTR